MENVIINISTDVLMNNILFKQWFTFQPITDKIHVVIKNKIISHLTKFIFQDYDNLVNVRMYVYYKSANELDLNNLIVALGNNVIDMNINLVRLIGLMSISIPLMRQIICLPSQNMSKTIIMKLGQLNFTIKFNEIPKVQRCEICDISW